MFEPKALDGPIGYPLVGNLFCICPMTLHKQVMEWRQQYGTIFKCSVLGKNLVFISSSDMIKKAFSDTINVNSRCETFLGEYILTEGIGVSQTLQPASASKHFLAKEMLTMADGDILCEVIRHWTEAMTADTTSDVDISPELRSIYQTFMSKQLIGDVIPDTDPDKDILWEFIDNLYIMIDPSVDGPLKRFPFLRHLPGYYGNVYRETIAARDKVAKRYFDDQKTSFLPGRIRGLVDVCISTQADDINKTGTSWLTDEYIKGLVFDTLAAGMTELMKSIRLFMLLMCHHQDVQSMLQSEIDSVIGTERFPMGTDRQWMPYTEAVMLEIWRYGSQTPLAIPHLCNKDVVLDGYLIEKGSVIFPNLYGVHHDEGIWGDPWEFRPNRFLDDSGSLLPSDHIYMQNVIPFSVGRRACPGQDFARSRTFISITSLLQRVRLLPSESSDLPSADPRLYTKQYPLSEPKFSCRVVSRENIII